MAKITKLRHQKRHVVETQNERRVPEIETSESQVVYGELAITEKQIEVESFVRLAEESAENVGE